MTQILNIDAIKHQLGYFFDGLPHDQIIDVCDLIQNISKKKQVNAFLNVWRSIVFSSNYVFGDDDIDVSFKYAKEFDNILESVIGFDLWTYPKTKSKVLIKQAFPFDFDYHSNLGKEITKKSSVYVINTFTGDYYLSPVLSTIIDKVLIALSTNLLNNFVIAFISEVAYLINMVASTEQGKKSNLKQLDESVLSTASLFWYRILSVKPYINKSSSPLFINYENSLPAANTKYYGRPHSLVVTEAQSDILAFSANKLLSQCYGLLLSRDIEYEKLTKCLLQSFLGESVKALNAGNMFFQFGDGFLLHWDYEDGKRKNIYDVTYHFSKFLSSLLDFNSQDLFDNLVIKDESIQYLLDSVIFNTEEYFDEVDEQGEFAIEKPIEKETIIEIGQEWFFGKLPTLIAGKYLYPNVYAQELDKHKGIDEKLTLNDFLDKSKLNSIQSDLTMPEFKGLQEELLDQFLDNFADAFKKENLSYLTGNQSPEIMMVSDNFKKYLEDIDGAFLSDNYAFFIEKRDYYEIETKIVGYLIGRLNYCKTEFNNRKLFNNINIAQNKEGNYSLYYKDKHISFNIDLNSIVCHCCISKCYKQTHINIDKVYIDYVVSRLNMYFKYIVCDELYQRIQNQILGNIKKNEFRDVSEAEFKKIAKDSEEFKEVSNLLNDIRDMLFSFSNEIAQDSENFQLIMLIYRLYNAVDLDEDYLRDFDPLLAKIELNDDLVGVYKKLIKDCNFDIKTILDIYFPFELKAQYKKVNKKVLAQLLNDYMLGLSETIVEREQWKEFVVSNNITNNKNSEESIENMNINIPTIGETVSNEHFTNRLKMALFGRNERIYLLNGISELEFINALNQDESSIPSMYLDAKNPILLKKDSYKFKDVLPAKLKERWEGNKDGELAVFVNLTLGDTVSTYKRPYFNNNIDMGYDLKDMEDLLSAFKELNLSDTKTTIFIYISDKLPDNTRSYISRLSFPIITLRPAGSKTIEENYIRYFFEQSEIKLSDFDKCYEKITRYIQKIGCDDKRGYDYIFDLIYSKAQIDGKKEIDSVYIENTLSQYCDYGMLNVNVESKVNTVELKDKLKEQIMGQDKAIEEISEQMMLANSGLTQSGFDKPLASFLFIGRSGTGKTETAIQLSKILGMELIRFDMSEYSSKHYADNLIGSPVGYIGSDRGGLLTNAVQKNPNSIILFDEIEKAHPSIQHKFYQILDYGMMTDAMGNKVDFTKTIVIFTTNTGANEKYSSFGMINDADTIARGKEEALKEAVSKQFDEALRGRIDKMITYQDLSKNVIEAILDKEINLIKERMSSIYRIGFEFVSSQAEVLKSYSSSIEAKLDDLIGVRDIKKELNSKLTKVLALALSNRNIVNSEPIKIDFVNNEFIVK